MTTEHRPAHAEKPAHAPEKPVVLVYSTKHSKAELLTKQTVFINDTDKALILKLHDSAPVTVPVKGSSAKISHAVLEIVEGGAAHFLVHEGNVALAADKHVAITHHGQALTLTVK